MELMPRLSLATLLAAGLATSSVAAAAESIVDPAANPIETIVVYGTPAELVLDTASLRVDVKAQASAIGRSVRNALGEKSETRVAAAKQVPRG
jgi:hypothetical protein